MSCSYYLRKYEDKLEVLRGSRLFSEATFTPKTVQRGGQKRFYMKEGRAVFHDESVLLVHAEHGVLDAKQRVRIERYSYQYMDKHRHVIFRFENNRGPEHVHDSRDKKHLARDLGLDIHNLNSLVVIRCCRHYQRSKHEPVNHPDEYAKVIWKARREAQ